MDINNLLKSINLFSLLNEEEIAQLSSSGHFVHFEANQLVFQEGSPGDAMYLILEGAVKVCQMNADGVEMEIARLKDGDNFGVMALIDGNPRSSSIVTLKPADFFVIERDFFLDFLSRSPKLGKKVLEDLSKIIRETNEQFFRAALQKEKLKTEAEAERRKAITQLVASVAHEMNTPLGIINNAASIISENVAETPIADAQEALDLIMKNVQKLDKLIRLFKNLSSIEHTDEKEKTDIKKLLEESVHLYKLSNKSSHLNIEIQCDIPETELIWNGYPGYFFQIIDNLLSNIDRYAYDQDSGKVDIALSKEKGDFLITVRDYGHGIEKEHAAKIFTPFFTTGRDRGGIGLGLSIVHNLVSHAMHGKIDFQSEKGKGTIFSLYLPSLKDE